MAAYIPTAPSRMLEAHKDLLTFKAQLEQIHSRPRRARSTGSRLAAQMG
jgi:hypothetical protein